MKRLLNIVHRNATRIVVTVLLALVMMASIATATFITPRAGIPADPVGGVTGGTNGSPNSQPTPTPPSG